MPDSTGFNLPPLGTNVPTPPPLRPVQVQMPQTMGAPALPKSPSLGQQQGGMGQMMQQSLAYGLSGPLMNQMFGGTNNPFATPVKPPTPNLAGMGQPAAPAVTSSTTGSSFQPDTSSHSAFVQSMAPVAQQWSQRTGIPANVLLAMNISESNWGNAPGNELFGIKAPGDAGSINSPTWESVNGQRVNTNSDFGAYSSPDAAYGAFWNLISTSPRYKGAMTALQSGDTNGFLQGLVDGGYATDPNWGNAIQSIANTTVSPMLSS